TYARFGLLDDRVRFLQGEFAATLPHAPIEKIALLRVDTGSYVSTRTSLDVLYDRLAVGGFVLIDNCRSAEARRAVEDFRSDRGIDETLEGVDYSAAGWRKLQQRPREERIAVGTGRHAPIPPPRQGTTELSVVVVFYDMRREAERTLRSLSRSYQEG